MSINSVTIKSGATVSVTGGTDLAFALVQNKGNVVVSAATADTDVRTRRKGTLRTYPAKANSAMPNGFTQIKSEATFHEPRTLANGKLATDQIKFFAGFDVETSEANKDEMITRFIQFVNNADFRAFVKRGVLA